MCHDRYSGESYRCSQGWYDDGSCTVAVAFDLSGVQARFDKQGSVELRVCFDESCDELELAVGADGERTCNGKAGGPPDQLTWCSMNRDGSVEIVIERIDGADYSDGSRHVAAFAARKDGERIYSYAEQVTFGSSGCGVQTVRLAQGERTPAP